MFTHSAPLDSSFSMHDCCATGLRIEKDTLILTFEDGVWACAGSAVNPGEKTIRTGRAEVRLDGFTAEETELAYFRELRFFTKNKKNPVTFCILLCYDKNISVNIQ